MATTRAKCQLSSLVMEGARSRQLEQSEQSCGRTLIGVPSLRADPWSKGHEYSDWPGLNHVVTVDL